MNNVLIQKFNSKIEAHLYNYYWKQLGLFDWEKRIEERKNEIERCKTILESLELISGIHLKNKQFLDIGCGWGGFLTTAAIKGANVIGCDIDSEVIKIAELRLKLHSLSGKIFLSPAEKLPFEDKSFDIIFCISVIEHVNDVGKTIREISRVLKDDGIAWIQAPNYWAPIEPHYKIIFPPKCPKLLAKIWLKMIGRPVKFIDSINYTDPTLINKECLKNGLYIYNINKVPKKKYKPKINNIKYKKTLRYLYFVGLNIFTNYFVKIWEKVFKIERINYIVSHSNLKILNNKI